MENKNEDNSSENIEQLKKNIRDVCRNYTDRFQRARRIFIEERAFALKQHREVEYKIKSRVSGHYKIPYSAVCFTGSAQIGFSITKNTKFEVARSDLDIACVDSRLYENVWSDIIDTTRAFTDDTKFSGLSPAKIFLFKETMLRRGMILVEDMPRSTLSRKLLEFEQAISREHRIFFGKMSVAIYMSEYAFCWKQDSSLKSLMEG